MKEMYTSCCGIAAGQKEIRACLIKKGGDKENRLFGTSASDLEEMACWLKEEKCQMAAVEMSGSFWEKVCHAFEQAHLSCIAVSMAHMKKVSGRGDDQMDAERIADLLWHGLLKAVPVPDREQRDRHEMEDYCQSLKASLAREKGRVREVLEEGEPRISCRVTDVFGKSGRAFLNALMDGRRLSAEEIEELIGQKVLSNPEGIGNEVLAEEMEGFLTAVQKFLLKKMLNHMDQLTEHIRQLERTLSEL